MTFVKIKATAEVNSEVAFMLMTLIKYEFKIMLCPIYESTFWEDRFLEIGTMLEMLTNEFCECEKKT